MPDHTLVRHNMSNMYYRKMDTHPNLILHLGLGAFHRAHQAVYLHRLHQLGDLNWAIAAGNIRSEAEDPIRALQAAHGRYTLETISPAGEYRYEVIESIRTVVSWDPGLRGLISIGASPATRIISFTVTETGYYLDAFGNLDLSAAALARDLAAAQRGEPASTIYGALSAILRARREAQAGPVSLLSCDNLRHNGSRFRAAFLQFLQLTGDPGLLEWVRENTSCPNAVVDRITPRPDAAARSRVRAATGRDDPSAISSERFLQWVIEDRFMAGRPQWEQVGVQIVDSVDPYEAAKISVLNASHSCLAWGGTLAGYTYICEAVKDERLRRVAFDYVTDDVIPTLLSSGTFPFDPASYRDSVFERFANTAIRDTNERVAADSIAKFAGFIAPVIEQRLSAGAEVQSSAMLAALLLRFMQRCDRGELPYLCQDGAMPTLGKLICCSADPIDALCRSETLCGAAAGHPMLIAAVRAAAMRVDAMIVPG
jgi:D-arabinitol 4-dehydrogenase